MTATIVSHEFVDNWNQDVDVFRHLGRVRNISVEVWRSKVNGRIALTVSPTVQGFTVVAMGRVDEVETFAKVGGCILAALSGVVPLVTGEVFREPHQSFGAGPVEVKR